MAESTTPPARRPYALYAIGPLLLAAGAVWLTVQGYQADALAGGADDLDLAQRSGSAALFIAGLLSTGAAVWVWGRRPAREARTLITLTAICFGVGAIVGTLLFQ